MAPWPGVQDSLGLSPPVRRGRCLQPTFLVSEHLAAGTLVELMPRYRSIELGIFALYPSRNFVAPKVRLLIEHVSRAFAKADWVRDVDTARPVPA